MKTSLNSTETEEFTPESAQIWRNLYSFAARCMGAGTLGPYTQVIDALREALEEKPDTDRQLARAECRIQVACEWIAHSGKPLLWWARENIGHVDVAEDGTQYFPGGPLYEGPLSGSGASGRPCSTKRFRRRRLRRPRR
ncbi:hypothetical protein F4677DRAFT_445042 [Hypoxylon crocopeplum]|nr:hypothetical protein F4677DRAFT_445042 [Hypoxylon crocopeplum]